MSNVTASSDAPLTDKLCPASSESVKLVIVPPEIALLASRRILPK